MCSALVSVRGLWNEIYSSVVRPLSAANALRNKAFRI